MSNGGGLKKLLNNNLFVFIVSLVLAFAIWLTYSVYGGEVQEKTFDAVPVTFDSMSVPEQFNLEAFGEYTKSIQVTVNGRKSAVGTATENDIKVVAVTNAVTTSGKQTLQLSVSSTNPNIEIVNYYPLYIEVYFDSYAEVQMDLTANITGLESPGSQYRIGEPALSQTKVKASGPATEVNKIDKILAAVNVEDTITSTTTFDTAILPIDKYGNEIQNITVAGADDIKLTIPVYKKAKLPVKVDFTNVPTGIDVNDYVTYSAGEISVEAEESTIDSLTSLSVGKIDFTTLSNSKKSFKFSLQNLPGIIVTDGTKEVTATVNLSSFTTRRIKVPANAVTVSNSTSYKCKINDYSIPVTVIGPKNKIGVVDSGDIVAALTVENSMKKGDNSAYLALSLKGSSGCWVYGSYKVSFTLS